MKVPTKIKVGAIDYKVTTFKEPQHDETGEYRGRVRYRDRTMHIVQDSIAIDTADTTLHETLHCIVDHYGLHNILKDNEEQTVSQLASGLIMVFRDNPKLLKYITEAVNGQ